MQQNVCKNHVDDGNNEDRRIPSPVALASSGSGTASSPSLTKNVGPAAFGQRLANPPCLIVYRRMRFLLMDAPSESTVTLYVKEMLRHHVVDLVRVCDPTYPRGVVESAGIRVHDWIFPDGAAPPPLVISQWLGLVKARFYSADDVSSSSSSDEEQLKPTIAVHCVAGLGRAPVLIAIALIEAGMDPFDAVMFIRRKRRGAINQMQLKFLETYHHHKHRRGRFTSSRCAII